MSYKGAEHLCYLIFDTTKPQKEQYVGMIYAEDADAALDQLAIKHRDGDDTGLVAKEAEDAL
jgi:hypothetical protein